MFGAFAGPGLKRSFEFIIYIVVTVSEGIIFVMLKLQLSQRTFPLTETA